VNADASDIAGPGSLTDEELAAQAAREGSDGAAFTALMDRYREKVWRVCWRLMGSEHDAEDAAQEVFVRLFFERGKFAGRSTYSTWLHGVAIRTCLMLRRSRSRRRAAAPWGSLPTATPPRCEGSWRSISSHRLN